MRDFNLRLAKRITDIVGTMWAAYAFAALALISLPKAISSGDILVIVEWTAQTFLQLVLLSIIMVGQGISSSGTEKTIRETHDIVYEELQSMRKLIEELQDVTNELHAKDGTKQIDVEQAKP